MSNNLDETACEPDNYDYCHQPYDEAHDGDGVDENRISVDAPPICRALVRQVGVVPGHPDAEYDERNPQEVNSDSTASEPDTPHALVHRIIHHKNSVLGMVLQNF